MPQSESIELVGAKELERILLSLDAKVARKLSSKALRAGAKVIQAEAVNLAPVKSGALRNAIKVRAGKNKKGFRSIRVAIGEKWFTGDQFYAAFIEMGWKHGSRKLGNKRKQIPGLHFMEKAAHNKMNEAVAVVTDTLKELANTAVSA